MMERVEAAIKAVYTCQTCGAYCANGVPPAECEGRCSLAAPSDVHRARAAIEAMRESLVATISGVQITARNTEDRAHNEAVEQCMAAVSDMIDAALS